MILFCTILFVLIAVHALADFPMQGDFMAKYKAESWLTLVFHGFIHGLGVFIVATHFLPDNVQEVAIELGLAETFLHVIIDKLKLVDVIDFNGDQIVHLVCKLGWTLVIFIAVLAS